MEIEKLYENFLNFFINFINELEKLLKNNKLTYKEKLMRLSELMFEKDKRIYIGILLIIISFILYFIDNTT